MKILKPILDAHPDWFEKTNIIYDAEAIFVDARNHLSPAERRADYRPKRPTALLQEEMDLASAADCVVAVSEQDGEHFRKHGIEQRSHRRPLARAGADAARLRSAQGLSLRGRDPRRGKSERRFA